MQNVVQKTVAVRSAAILTTSYVAGTVIEQTRGFNRLAILIDFTKGSLTTAEVKVEFSEDNTNWYQETFSSVSTGTDTNTLGEHQISATGKYKLPEIDINANYIRISAKGTGTVTSSSMKIDAILSEV